MRISSSSALDDFLGSLDKKIKSPEENSREELIKNYVDQVGGVAFILPDNEPILSYPFKEFYINNEYWEELDESHRSAEAIFVNIDNPSDSGLWKLKKNHRYALRDIFSTFETKLLFTKKEGKPGFYFFGKVLGKSKMIQKYWNPIDFSPLVLSGGNLPDKYKAKSDNGTRYVFEKFGIDILYQKNSSEQFHPLPQIKSLIKGGQKSASDGSLTEIENLTGNLKNEGNPLKEYFYSRSSNGTLLTEFCVTTMIESSSTVRFLDGLYLRNSKNRDTEEPSIFESASTYNYLKKLIDKGYPCEAIEVHKWGWRGFGQVVGKALLLEDFWNPAYVRKVFVVTDSANQPTESEVLRPAQPQPDMEQVMNDLGVEIFIAS